MPRDVRLILPESEKHKPPFQHVSQLPDVSRPTIYGKGFQGASVSFDGRQKPHFLAELDENLLNQNRQILFSSPQGRYANGEHVQPVIQVAPEPALGDFLVKFFVRGCYQSGVYGNLRLSTDAGERPGVPRKSTVWLALAC